MQKLDNRSAIPLYQQLADEIRYAVERGEYKSGEQIPSEDKLREMYGISRITVRKALERLVEDNILIKKHGKGTFVSNTEYVETAGVGGSFTQSCLLMNAVPNTRILLKERGRADTKIASILDVQEGSSIIRIDRLRCVNKVPVILEKDYFLPEYDFLWNIDLEDRSLLSIIREQGGKSPCNFQDVFDVRPASKSQAELLDCPVKHPLLRVSQRVYGTDGSLIYYNEQYILSEQYKYAVNSL